MIVFVQTWSLSLSLTLWPFTLSAHCLWIFIEVKESQRERERVREGFEWSFFTLLLYLKHAFGKLNGIIFEVKKGTCACKDSNFFRSLFSTLNAFQVAFIFFSLSLSLSLSLSHSSCSYIAFILTFFYIFLLLKGGVHSLEKGKKIGALCVFSCSGTVKRLKDLMSTVITGELVRGWENMKEKRARKRERKAYKMREKGGFISSR